MNITINGVTYELHFGWAFLKHANEFFGLEAEGINTKAGAMPILMAGASMKDPVALMNLIKCGLASERTQPSNKELEDYIEELIEKDLFEETFDELLGNIKKRPLLQKATMMEV